MHAMRGLLWEQWRQSRYWVLCTCVFLIVLTGVVALGRPWLLRMFGPDFSALDTLAWVVGFTLLGMLFVNQRMGDITLHFPGRLFALPCRTNAVVTSQLLYKSGIAVLLGALIAIFHCVLLSQERPSLHPIILFLALVSGVQGLVLLATVRDTRSALCWGTLAGGLCLTVIYSLQEVLHLSEDAAIYVAASAMTGLGWLVALACGPGARQCGRAETSGKSALSMDGAVSRELSRPVFYIGAFSSPAWAQCWYAWRRTVVWVPRILLPATLLWTLGALGAIQSYWVELSANIASAAAAITLTACTYFLLWISPAERRFVLALPGGEKAIADGKLLAAGLASLFVGGVALISGIVCIATFTYLSPHRFSADALPHFVWLLFLTGIGIWITLTSTPFYLMATVAAVGLFCLLYAVTVPIGLLLKLGVSDNVAVMLWIFAVTALIFALWRGLRARQLPMPWEAGLGLLAFGPDIIHMLFAIDLNFPIRIGDQISLRLPFFLLLGGLLFARRVGLVSWRRLGIALLGHVAMSALCLIPIANYIRFGIFTDSDYIFYLIAACFAPVIWVPLAVRMQRYR